METENKEMWESFSAFTMKATRRERFIERLSGDETK